MIFDDFLEALQDNHFEEIPVDAKTFIESPDYLGQPGLSDIQYDIVQAMSQIYRKEDLQQLMGDEEGARYYEKYTKTKSFYNLGRAVGRTLPLLLLVLILSISYYVLKTLQDISENQVEMQ